MCIITMFHAFSFVFTLLQWLCAVRFGLGWAHDVFKFACHMFMHTYLQVSIFLYILSCWCFSDCLSLSPSISLSCVSCFMAPKHKSTPSQNPLHSGAFSSSDPTPSHVRFRDEKARKDVSEKFSRRGIHLERQVILLDFMILTYPLSSTIGVGSHCVAPQSLALPWSYKSLTPICMDLILQYLNFLLAFEVRALWSFQILYPRCSMSRV